MTILNINNRVDTGHDSSDSSIGSLRLSKNKEKAKERISLEKSGFSVEKSNLIKNQEIARFVRDNQDLLSVVNQSEDVQKTLERKDLSNRQNLVDAIAETAHQFLSADAGHKISEESLRSRPVISSLIVLNSGGFRDLLNNDKEALELFAQGGTDNLAFSKDRLSEKASDLFKNSRTLRDNPLHDKAFFNENPEAAVYLLTQPSLVKQFNENEDAANEFKASVQSGGYQALLQDYISTFAKVAVNSGSYSTTFFEDNPEIAQFVAAGELDPYVPTSANLLGQHPEYNLNNKATGDNFNFSFFSQNVLAAQASKLLSPHHPFDPSFLQTETGLSNLIIQKEDFRSKVDSDDSRKTLHTLINGFPPAAPLSEKTQDLIKRNFKSAFESAGRFLSVVA